MDKKFPNENGGKKIETKNRNQGQLKRYATYGVYLVLLLIIIKHFLKQYAVVDLAISIIIIAMLLAIFYLVIKSELNKNK